MSHDHHHHPASLPPHSPARGKRLTLMLLIPALLVTIAGMVLLWPRDTPGTSAPPDGPVQVNGEVLTVAPQPCPAVPATEEELPANPDAICGTVTVKLTSGKGKGTNVITVASFASLGARCSRLSAPLWPHRSPPCS